MTFAKLIGAAPDGGYFFCGGMYSDIVVGKIDSLGNLQWAKQIGDVAIQELPYDLVVLNNGNMVAAIRWYDGTNLKTYFISYDLAGNLVFFKRYANANSGQDNILNNMIKDGNGFCAAISNYPINEMRLIKADSAANKTGSASILGKYRGVFKDSDGNYLLFAPFTTEIVKLDQSLNYQNSAYTNTYIGPGYYYGMLEISNNSYLLYGEYLDGSGIIAKVNSQLQFEWQKFYDFDFATPEGKIATAQLINNNKIAFFGQGETWGNNPYILLTDTLGNVLDCKLITTTGTNPDNCPSQCIYKNNRFTFMYNLSTGVFFQNITCFKITSADTSFSQICNAVDTTMIIFDDIIISYGGYSYTCGPTNDSLVSDSLPIINISFPFGACNDSTLSINSFLSAETDFNLYPNPFKSMLNINVNNNELSEIILYDITARKILQQEFTNSISLNTEQLVKGIYIYEVRNKNGLCKKGKVVKD